MTAAADSNPPHPDPAKITVPRAHGQILIDPPLATLALALRRRAAYTATIHGQNWADLSNLARSETIAALERHAARTGATIPENLRERPWILTGHQVEFYHPGVWAKVIAADALAKSTQAVAIDLLVDHDIVEDFGFDIPSHDAQGDWHRTKETWDHWPGAPLPAEAVPPELLANIPEWASRLQNKPNPIPIYPKIFIPEPPGTPETRGESAAATGSFGNIPALKIFTQTLGNSAAGNYVQRMSRARHVVEQSLGLNILHVPTSALCEGDAWLHFVGAWIANAPAWSAAYNRRVRDYRARHHITNRAQPMPDLEISPHAIELPFWIYKLGEPRGRLAVSPAGDLLLNSEKISLGPEAPLQALKTALQSRQLHIRPRALTLTIFARLLLADLFIHGIGGALYDQITDALLADLFHVSTPYACVSAAWLLLPGKNNSEPRPKPGLRWQLHHLRHNPPLVMEYARRRSLDPKVPNDPKYDLPRQRRETLQKIQDSLRHHRREQTALRKELFRQIHATNQQLHALDPQPLAAAQSAIAHEEHRRQQQKILNYREWFFGLFPQDSLHGLVKKIQQQI